ncbi:MAG: magnesium/cobalt transporter CorA [Rhodospirillales bacterium]|nr:magnesium/cobalt transporter CorA [Rhodospirillales bacterium]
MAFADLRNEYESPMVVACAVYRNGVRIRDIPVEDAGPAALADGEFVWIGLHEPSIDILTHVQNRFGLHPLAVEDANRSHQRPKIDLYGEALFMVLRTAQVKDACIVYGETHLFAGRGYVIAVRHGPSTSYGDVRQRCERERAMFQRGTGYVIYAIMDFVADNFFPVIDTIAEEVAEIESHIIAKTFTSEEVNRLYQLRRELLGFRRSVSPMQEVCARLERYNLPIIDAEMRPYYHDVHDHVLQVNESIDNLREALASAFDAAMMLSASSQNEVTKRLAAWAAILAVPTAIAGIYGMNFEHMPELRWDYGYPAVVGAIVAICGVLYWRFRKADWL